MRRVRVSAASFAPADEGGSCRLAHCDDREGERHHCQEPRLGHPVRRERDNQQHEPDHPSTTRSTATTSELGTMLTYAAIHLSRVYVLSPQSGTRAARYVCGRRCLLPTIDGYAKRPEGRSPARRRSQALSGWIVWPLGDAGRVRHRNHDQTLQVSPQPRLGRGQIPRPAVDGPAGGTRPQRHEQRYQVIPGGDRLRGTGRVPDRPHGVARRGDSSRC